jgi:hypothetical protein
MYEDLLRSAYAAFNARDIDSALALKAPDVHRPRAFEGDHVTGTDAVRDYWTRQFTEIDARVEPVGFSAGPGGTVDVDVHQVVRDLNGAVLSDTHTVHRWTIVEDRVQRMDIEE